MGDRPLLNVSTSTCYPKLVRPLSFGIVHLVIYTTLLKSITDCVAATLHVVFEYMVRDTR